MVIKMGITEIVLIIAGVIVLALGYLLPNKKRNMDEEVLLIGEDEVRKLVDREVDSAKSHINDIIDETVTYAIEKTERSMERVTNEKIMAINEYSDTVLEEINKNHKEVLFLYDMLNDKHETLKDTISQASGDAEEVKQAVKDAEISAREVQDAVKNLAATVLEADESAQNAVSIAQSAIDEVREYAAVLLDNKESYQAAALNMQMYGAYDGAAEKENLPYEEEDMGETSLSGRHEEDAEDIRMSESYADAEDMRIPERREPIEEDGFKTAEEYFASYGSPDEIDDDINDAAQAEEELQQESDDFFVPITPPRVEIIHDLDGDYVAEPAPVEERIPFEERIPEERIQQKARRKPVRKEARQAETKSVNIQFAKGKDNGRNSNERILELHKAGKSNMAIAKELGLGIGEVKLVIDLFEGM